MGEDDSAGLRALVERTLVDLRELKRWTGNAGQRERLQRQEVAMDGLLRDLRAANPLASGADRHAARALVLRRVALVGLGMPSADRKAFDPSSEERS